MNRLGAKLRDIDSCLEAERLRLVHEWRRLEVTVNLSRLQHASARSKDEKSFAEAKRSS